MSLVKDVVIATFDRSVEAELRRQVNGMGNSISTAYLLALRARNVDTTRFEKLLVSLHREKPHQPHEDAVDVYIYNCQFDFDDFKRASYDERCNLLLETLHQGLLQICKVLELNCSDFTSAYEEVKASNFVYKYRKGKSVASKQAGLAAQLGMISTPAWTSVVAYLQRLDDGHEVGTSTFVKTDKPELRFEARYVGKLKWVSPSRLALIPKDPRLSPIEVDVPVVH